MNNSNYLQQGINALQSGNYQQAKADFEKQLKLNPKDPNAKQLLGLVYSANGNNDEAIQLMRESLDINPQQPHVLNNLGALLKRQGNIDEAKRCYSQALSQKADYVDALVNLVSLMNGVGDAEASLELLAEKAGMVEQNLKLLKLKAETLSNLHRYAEAEAVYIRILESSADDFQAKHDLALVKRLQGNSQEALNLYQSLEAAGVRSYILSHNIANAHSDVGDLQAAIKYFRDAIQQSPGYIDSHKNLTEMLWEVGEKDQIFDSYLSAMQLEPQSLELKFAYVRSLNRFSQYELARNFLIGFADAEKTNADFHDLLALSYQGLKDHSAAIEEYKFAINHYELTSEHLVNYSTILLETNQAEEAAKILETVVASEPNDQMALGYLGVAWRLMGSDKAQQLNDFDRMVKEYFLEPPEGFENVEDYCADLDKLLMTLHTGEQEPSEQTLVGGTQTRGNLFDNQDPLIQHFVEQVKGCVDDYLENTQLLGALPETFDLEQEIIFSGSWSVKLKKSGFHVPHIHPMGRISSAFYVQLPASVEDEEQHQGWFQVGQPKLKLAEELLPEKYVKPAVGKLVFFPSYMWHGTIPFESSETRTTIAFDVAFKNY